MRLKECVRWLSVVGLIVILGVPPGAWTAHAQQQEGPAKATPPQQPEPTKPPTGQQNGPQAQAPDGGHAKGVHPVRLKVASE